MKVPRIKIAPNGVEIRRHNESTKVIALKDGALFIQLERGGLKGEDKVFGLTFKRLTVQSIGMRLSQESAMALMEVLWHQLAKSGKIQLK